MYSSMEAFSTTAEAATAMATYPAVKFQKGHLLLSRQVPYCVWSSITVAIFHKIANCKTIMEILKVSQQNAILQIFH